MSNEDFKAPDVVWIATEELEIAVEENYGYCTVSLPIAAFEGDETSYTLTTTAEANTRKAVEDALAELVEYLEGCSNKLDRAGAELYSVLPIIKHARELILNGYKHQQLKATE